MKFVVNNLSIWLAPEQQVELNLQSTSELDLSWIPAMQRRRLSSFAKMALHTLNQSANNTKHAVTFSSRHGDLNKTAKLLDCIATAESLSPTAFGLSVHNAAAGLFSIISDNTHSINAIAPGDSGIISALTDAYAKLLSGIETSMLVCHTDEVLPQEYHPFADERQISHSIAFELKPATAAEPHYELVSVNKDVNELGQQPYPVSVQLMKALMAKENSEIKHNNKAWMLKYHASQC